MSAKEIHPGDNGKTGFRAEGSLPKYDLRIEALGELDETSSILGIIRSLIEDEELSLTIHEIQDDLQIMMGEIALPIDQIDPKTKFNADKTKHIEEAIAKLQNQIALPNHFINPGDHFSSALMDFGRAVIRRAERRVAEASDKKLFENPEILRYINRLSTLFFWLELKELQNPQ
jgi:cob(I)alamin adenosyltransferase